MDGGEAVLSVRGDLSDEMHPVGELKNAVGVDGHDGLQRLNPPRIQLENVCPFYLATAASTEPTANLACVLGGHAGGGDLDSLAGVVQTVMQIDAACWAAGRSQFQ